jgi:TonB family protein
MIGTRKPPLQFVQFLWRWSPERWNFYSVALLQHCVVFPPESAPLARVLPLVFALRHGPRLAARPPVSPTHREMQAAEVEFMPEPSITSESATGAPGFQLVTEAQAEQALCATIERFEQSGDSPLELAQALIRLGTLRQQKESYADAEVLFAKAVDVSEQILGSDHIDLVPALTSLGAVRVRRGSPEAAEPLLNRAVAISERYLGQGHPDLVILVTDLSRLCLKNGAYSLAEPLLQRLLKMKRSKGEDHPEVATVLASLAVVHESRGKHESAEGLWRRVLDIRQRTLSPNHFAHAVALEHLADVCAARGKIAEALQLFQRARSIREATLGSSHPSLRVIRERVADLELQASELSTESYDTPVFAPQSAPPPVFEREVTPPKPEISASLEAEREAAAFAYRAALLERRHDALDADDDEQSTSAPVQVLEATWAFLRKQYREVLTVAGVLAFLLITLAVNSRASVATDQASAEIPAATSVSAPTLLPGPPVAIAQTKIATPDTSFLVRESASSRSRPVEQHRSEKPTERKTPQASISIPTLSPLMMTRFDSIFGAAGAAARVPGEVSIKAPPASIATSRPDFNFTEPSTPQRTRARLIGALPTPRYPDQLIGVEGEVEVRFNVDTTGRPVMSTFSVVSSPELLFTEAVRKAIIGMRFEPARSGGPKSTAVVDAVDVRFVFTVPKRS